MDQNYAPRQKWRLIGSDVRKMFAEIVRFYSVLHHDSQSFTMWACFDMLTEAANAGMDPRLLHRGFNFLRKYCRTPNTTPFPSDVLHICRLLAIGRLKTAARDYAARIGAERKLVRCSECGRYEALHRHAGADIPMDAFDSFVEEVERVGGVRVGKITLEAKKRVLH